MAIETKYTCELCGKEETFSDDGEHESWCRGWGSVDCMLHISWHPAGRYPLDGFETPVVCKSSECRREAITRLVREMSEHVFKAAGVDVAELFERE